MGTDTSWEWPEGLETYQEGGLRQSTGRRGPPYGSLAPLVPHPAWAPAGCVTLGTARHFSEPWSPELPRGNQRDGCENPNVVGTQL